MRRRVVFGVDVNTHALLVGNVSWSALARSRPCGSRAAVVRPDAGLDNEVRVRVRNLEVLNGFFDWRLHNAHQLRRLAERVNVFPKVETTGRISGAVIQR